VKRLFSRAISRAGGVIRKAPKNRISPRCELTRLFSCALQGPRQPGGIPARSAFASRALPDKMKNERLASRSFFEFTISLMGD